MEKELKKYKLELKDDLNDKSGVQAISIVTDPAIQHSFMLFNKQTKIIFSTNEEKRIITGPVLIPNRMIYRREEKNLPEREVYLTEDTIKKALVKFNGQLNNNNTTLEHTDKIDKSKTTYFQNWLIADENIDTAFAPIYKDKFKGLPVGTWMTSLQVNDENLWEEIKENGFTGFSIEGFFENVEDTLTVNTEKDESLSKNNKTEMKKNKNWFARLKEVFSEIETDYKFEDVKTKEGVMYSIDSDGNVTDEAGVVVADGDYTLEDDSILTIKDGKKVEKVIETDTTANSETVEVKAEAIPLADGEYLLASGTVLTIKDGLLVIAPTEVAPMVETEIDAKGENQAKIEAEVAMAKQKQIEKDLKAENIKLKAEIVELGKKPASQGIGNIGSVNGNTKELSLTEQTIQRIKRIQGIN